ncbi:hypothetical protein O2N63_02895 [Aliiroseovarius sp. KMU-50]|uniref:Translocase n=1 Tax=Aliiroseovarius salicola TaxID=3009082 RepID=A0ABT4VXQ7_9RHOB|nr:hypothetical protein [Aliiroseovarius sp. KMU-50]MDA5093024.1 hypothetical protein [Aliiroseovarius sp. KMU-50]
MRNIVGQLKAIDLKSVDLKGIDKKRMGTAAVTLVVALGAGYYMQAGKPAASQGQPTVAMPVQTASVMPVSTDEPVEAAIAASPAEIAGAADSTTLAEEALADVSMADEIPPANVVLEANVVQDEVASAQALDPASEDVGTNEVFDLAALETTPPSPVESNAAPLAENACEPVLTAVASDMAMMTVTISAPCHANATVEFAHEGLRFSERLDENGEVSQLVPALLPEAKVTAYLDDDSSAEVELTIPEASQYYRAALVWQGATGLQLHAFEEGADYGQEGHLWSEAPGNTARSKSGLGGYVTMLGTVAKGYAADVYTFPAYLMRSLTGPKLSIEAHVLENTCENNIEAVYLRADGSNAPTQMPVEIFAPGCDAIGEYLVLQDMPKALQIALK